MRCAKTCHEADRDSQSPIHPLPSLDVDDDSLCEIESNVCFTHIDKVHVYAIRGFSCIRLCVLHDYCNGTSHQRLKEAWPLLLTAF